MSCVHYKFYSKLDYNTVTFDGLYITLSELKKQIMGRERLKATDCDLQITNAQTQEGTSSTTCFVSVLFFFFKLHNKITIGLLKNFSIFVVCAIVIEVLFDMIIL